VIMSEEYRRRVAKLRALLQARDYDLFIGSTTDTLYYLTGAAFSQDERPVLFLVWADGRSQLVAPLLEKTHIGGLVPWAELRSYREYPAPEGLGWKTLSLETCKAASRIALEVLTRGEILQALGSKVSLEPFVDQLRLVKSRAELALIRRAAYYADRIVVKMREATVPGATVARVFANASGVTQEAVDELGSRYTPFLTSFMPVPWPAPMNAEPHRLPCMSDTFDSGPHNLTSVTRFDAYSAESERVVFLEPPPSEVTQAHDAVVEARRRAFSMLRPGQPTSEIDFSVNSFLKSEGYENRLLHRTGHGFGLGGHEGPWIAEGATDVLEENMVISVEPGVYIPGVGGIRDSDTVLITPKGFELLTQAPIVSQRVVYES